MELALFFTLPATIALMLCGGPIIATLFEHGQFGADDTVKTAQALAAFSLGLPAYILVKVLTPGFYARSDTRTPMRFAIIAIAVNLALNLALILPLKHVGPPLATAIASTVNVVLLYRELSKRGHFAADAQLKRRVWRLALAALAMGVVLWLAEGPIAPLFAGPRVERWAALIGLVAFGVVVYGVACFALGAFRLADIRRLLRRGEREQQV
jgi:putative peptidoglycan lipid II flippase